MAWRGGRQRLAQPQINRAWSEGPGQGAEWPGSHRTQPRWGVPALRTAAQPQLSDATPGGGEAVPRAERMGGRHPVGGATQAGGGDSRRGDTASGRSLASRGPRCPLRRQPRVIAAAPGQTGLGPGRSRHLRPRHYPPARLPAPGTQHRPHPPTNHPPGPDTDPGAAQAPPRFSGRTRVTATPAPGLRRTGSGSAPPRGRSHSPHQSVGHSPTGLLLQRP